MRSNLIVALVVVVGCDRADRDRPPPPPPPTPGDAFVDDVDREARLAALDRLRDHVRTTKRMRSPAEASPELTAAYLDFIFGYGYARLGQPARARELVASARAGLAEVATDPVHAYLSAAFSTRITQALAGELLTAPLPPALDAQLAALGRADRDKVDRLREVSRILVVTEPVDAIRAFSNYTGDMRGEELEKLRGMADRQARALALAKILDSVTGKYSDDAARPLPDHHVAQMTRLSTWRATVRDEKRVRLLEGILGECFQLRRDDARQLLARVVQQLAREPESTRLRLYAKALWVAVALDHDRVPELVTATATAFAYPVVGFELGGVLEDLLHALGKTHTRELATLWARAEHALGTLVPDLSTRVAYAAGRLRLGEPGVQPILDQAHALLAKHDLLLVLRTDLMRPLVLAYALAPRDVGIAGLERVARDLPAITDGLGTNTHYSQSVLGFVGVLVLGIVGE